MTLAERPQVPVSSGHGVGLLVKFTNNRSGATQGRNGRAKKAVVSEFSSFDNAERLDEVYQV